MLKFIELRANSCVEALYNSLVNIWWVPEGTRGKENVGYWDSGLRRGGVGRFGG